MLKTYAPRLTGADLRALLDELQATPKQAANFLQVTERTLFRWLADNSAPFSVLAALWHETPAGRHVTALDVGNELVINRGLAQAHEKAHAAAVATVGRLLAIGDFGGANDPLFNGPPPGGSGGFAAGPRYSAQVMRAQARAMRG
jgi:hypothetical protein